jgi:hypothetical protein
MGNSDPSTTPTGPPSVSGGLCLSSVMVVPNESLELSNFFLSLSSKSGTDLIASIFSIISILELLLSLLLVRKSYLLGYRGRGLHILLTSSKRLYYSS